MASDQRAAAARRFWPRPTSDGSSVVARAADEGQRAARNGMFDEWSFQPGTPIPYLEQLRHELALSQHRQDEHALTATRQAQADAIRARGRREAADERARLVVDEAERVLAERRAFADRTLDQLDLMSGVHLPAIASAPDQPDQPDPITPSFPPSGAPTVGPAPDPAFTGGAASEHSATVFSGTTGGRPRRLVRDHTPRSAARWMGPDDARLPLMVPSAWRHVLIVLLMAVETPIYYEVFRGFHPTNLTLRAVFTASVAFCMVVTPHVAGKLLRHRHARPYERVAPYAAGLLLTAWAGAAAYLGILRRAFVFRTVRDTESGVTLQPLGGLGLSQSTVTMTFLLILVMSGLIALALGLAEEHPGQRAFRYARRRVEGAEQARQRAFRDRAAARQDGWEATAAEPDPATSAEPHRLRRDSLIAEYATAAAAYLDAVAQEMAKPAVTQSIGRYLQYLREQDPGVPPQGTGPVVDVSDGARPTHGRPVQ